MTRLEETFCIFLIVLAIFILGVQVGIHHGRELAIREECQYDFLLAN